MQNQFRGYLVIIVGILKRTCMYQLKLLFVFDKGVLHLSIVQIRHFFVHSSLLLCVFFVASFFSCLTSFSLVSHMCAEHARAHKRVCYISYREHLMYTRYLAAYRISRKETRQDVLNIKRALLLNAY